MRCKRYQGRLSGGLLHFESDYGPLWGYIDPLMLRDLDGFTPTIVAGGGGGGGGGVRSSNVVI